MSGEAPNPTPDDTLLERILEAIETGEATHARSLAAQLSATESEVQRALDAIAHYQHELAGEQVLAPELNAVDVCERQLEPGTQIGDYVIEGRLGAGAMGVVYRARQVSLGDRPVALKVLPHALAARDPRFIARFRREAELAAAIHHPNIAEVYGIEEVGDTLCFAMRLIEGRTLHDVLVELSHRVEGADRTSSPEHVQRCAELVRGVADPLSEIHARGLVHRDVKPSNILLEGAGDDVEAALRCRPVLVDFGLLRPASGSELTGTRTLLGTPAYAAHESQLGRAVDARADVFSLGAVLHDLLTRTSPGTRGTATSGLGDVRTANRAVDARLAAIVEMALQERVELRYADGGNLRTELDRYVRGEPVRALPVGVIGRTRLWAHRNPTRAAKVGALAAAVTLLTIATPLWFGRLAIRLHALATRGQAHEQAGELLEAAAAFRELYASRDDTWLTPWLADDVEHAAVYAEPGGAVADAIDQSLLGRGTLANGGTPSVAEFALATAGACFCRVLFDESLVALHEPVRCFLLHEAGADTPEVRRRVAFDAFANYLMSQGKGQIAPAGLVGTLTAAIAEHGLQLDTRRAAVAALASIRTREAFLAVMPRLVDEDGACRRLAIEGMEHQWDWIHFEQSEVFNTFDEALLTEYARLLIASAAANDADGRVVNRDLMTKHLPRMLERIAWVLPEPTPPRDGERSATLAHLKGMPAARKKAAAARQAAESLGQDVLNTWQPQRDGSDGDPAFHYRRMTGRQPYMYERAIWLSATSEQQKAESGHLTFTPTSESWSYVDFMAPDVPIANRPLVTGTIREVSWRGSLQKEVRVDGPGYLQLRRPGTSRLTIRSIVPDGAQWVDIHVEQQTASRATVRPPCPCGFRASVTGTPISATGQASSISVRDEVLGIQLPDRIMRLDKVHTTRLSLAELEGKDEIEFLIELLYSSTTLRVNSVLFEWGM